MIKGKTTPEPLPFLSRRYGDLEAAIALQPSPQLQAVGEIHSTPDYASLLSSEITNQHSGQNLAITKLKPIEIIHGEPTIKFTMEEIQQFVVEEGDEGIIRREERWRWPEKNTVQIGDTSIDKRHGLQVKNSSSDFEEGRVKNLLKDKDKATEHKIEGEWTAMIRKKADGIKIGLPINKSPKVTQ
ncbi:hypothetical protein HAX54_049049 [Datura stramonium]|uniref:Uncharacterized protein n=1 Tax=Datura stramonium TaxID=4076 RepID=A0ABS8WM73_DATST|nr:hypothetical protein [Datura stramonium]